MGKNKRAAKTKTKTRARTATFVRGRHLVIDKAGAPPRTANVVSRAALNPDPPTEEGGEWGSPTVYFKPHDDGLAPSQYAVASTRLARFLGMPNLIARNAFAKVKNVRGVVSGAVPGSALMATERETEKKPDKTWGKQDIADWIKYSQIVERDGKYYDVSSYKYQWVNFADPRIQKGLSDLQLFDAISGQADRHGGNIFVDAQTGEVSGIDDDRSFGKGKEVADQAVPGGKYVGLPALVDEGTADRILALDVSDLPELLFARENDSEVLTHKEIEDAMQRLKGVQRHLRTLKANGDLVGQNKNPSWNDATYQQMLQAPASSYLGRQAADLANALQRSSANDPMYVVHNAPPLQPPPPPPIAPATTTAMPQPPPVMPPLPPTPPWQRPRLPLPLPQTTLPPQPSTSLGPSSPRTAVVSPSRATAARLAAVRTPRLVPATQPVVKVDDSGDSSEDSTTSSADD